MTDRPQMILVGGPNGAGKTTFVKRLIRQFDFRYLGADAIAAELCPTEPESVAFDAGREFIRSIDSLIESRTSFIVESTLAGKSLAKTIQRAKNKGYDMDIHCIFVVNPDESVFRVAERVRLGGHHVPSNDVIRRFARSLLNFWRLYRPLADTWSLHYNGDRDYVGVARSSERGIHVTDPALFADFRRLAGLHTDDR